ncbi:FUSC family protein [Halomonas urumqiensis]|uniref:FUSC family protein n=1 Tax=Halomonas urumqiensis TaxID=1684789 RepID=A0A2N7UQI4_9GAMM|nr:FUSC family protein [Halomonas urumqiensis]PMR82696.1 FUSC family protein [Halomonas urumqiensis]PTB01985.1 FUSC family protein [Halomonas urumqiensis]GHE22098.1 FUSC family protein [Halomonas urumqiensis]
MTLPPLRDPYYTYRYRRRLHVFRVLLALMITYTIITLFAIPHSGWALVSTVMVMGNLPHIGGVLDKGRQRLLGTLLGAGLGLTLIMLPLGLPALVPLGALAGIGVATWVTFSGRHGYSGLMFAISLLLVIGDGSHDLAIGLWRAFDVLLGTLIGIGVTVLVLPQKATDMMRFMLADNLDRMARLYHVHTTSTSSTDVDTRALLKATSSLLIKQRNLVDAIHREGRLDRDELDDLISLQRRMLSTIELLLESHWTTRDGHDRIEAMEGLRHEQHRLARELGSLAFQVRTGQTIDVVVSQFDLQRHAELAGNARGSDDRMLFSPSGYLWLNRELARLTGSLVSRLGGLTRLPSKRLRRASGRKWAPSSTTLDHRPSPSGKQDDTNPP